MKKKLLIVGAVAFILAACSGNQKKLDEDSIKIADLTAEYEEATSFNDSLMLLMGDIYTGLDSINTQEGLLYNMGNSENTNQRAEIRRNLSVIKARLAANKQLLADMEAKVKKSGNESSIQSKTIAQLKQHIEQQDAKIAKLESDLTAARGQIDELNTQVAAGQEQVKVETEANEVYYAIGTAKELKQRGLLEKKFLGTTKVLKGDFDASYFVKADKRTLRTIPCNAKKVKVWTNMPQGSYRIVGEKDGPKSIEIVNPDRFWSLASHLVVQIN